MLGKSLLTIITGKETLSSMYFSMNLQVPRYSKRFATISATKRSLTCVGHLMSLQVIILFKYFFTVIAWKTSFLPVVHNMFHSHEHGCQKQTEILGNVLLNFTNSIKSKSLGSLMLAPVLEITLWKTFKLKSVRPPHPQVYIKIPMTASTRQQHLRNHQHCKPTVL